MESAAACGNLINYNVYEHSFKVRIKERKHGEKKKNPNGREEKMEENVEKF